MNIPSLHIMLRYNTENTTNQYWRVLTNGNEETYETVEIRCGVRTTKDILERKESLELYTKYHITCIEPNETIVSEDGQHLIII